MKRRIEITAAMLLSVAAAVVAIYSWGAKRTLDVAPREHDFGTIRAGENVSRLYRLTNHTDQAVDIFSVGAG